MASSCLTTPSVINPLSLSGQALADAVGQAHTPPRGGWARVLGYVEQLQGQGHRLMWATVGPRSIDLEWLPAGADDALAVFTTSLCFSGALEGAGPLAGVAGTA